MKRRFRKFIAFLVLSVVVLQFGLITKVSATSYTLSVVVIASDGTPLSGITVKIYKSGQEAAYASSTTGSNGFAYFTIPSTYTIGINVSSYYFAKKYNSSSLYVTSNITTGIMVYPKAIYPDFVAPYQSYTAPNLTGQHFGWRVINAGDPLNLHKGIDLSQYTVYPALGIVTQSTKAIGSVCDGFIVESLNTDSTTGAGTYVIVGYNELSADNYQYYIKYYHMVDGSVSNQGYPVYAEGYIGLTGNTGSSTGAHLHIEISSYQAIGNTTVYDPNAFFN